MSMLISKKGESIKQLSISEFSQSASSYDDSGNYSMVQEDYDKIIKRLAKEDFSRLLDCGCGTGEFIFLLQKEYPDCKYVGIDITPAMIEESRKKNIDNASFYVCDSENISIDEMGFDVITCIHSFHHYPNPQDFLNSARRYLNDNGKLIIADNGRKTRLSYWFTNHVVYPIWNNRIMKQGDVHCYCKSEIIALAEKCGFEMCSFYSFDNKIICDLKKRSV